jgi:lactate dehydrogenase-like 2-hydroxyacid dehydrogenase
MMAATGPEKPRILVTRKCMPDVEKRLGDVFRATLNPDDRPMSRDEVLGQAARHDGIMLTSFDKLGPDFIPSLPPSIRIIATHSVGYDHLSIPQAREKGIAVTNTPGVLTDATADIAMLLILGAARGASWGDRMVREDRWGETTLISPMGFDVSAKRLGILGMGRIGRELAGMARGFRMEIHYRDVQRLSPEAEQGATYHADDDRFLGAIDVLSMHIPGGEATRKWLNAERIGRMKPGSIVINSGRGTTVDDEALIAALKSGHVRAAGLDVYDGEPRVNPGYLELENVALLPHLGSATIETRDAMGRRCLENLDAVLLQGTAPPHRVV